MQGHPLRGHKGTDVTPEHSQNKSAMLSCTGSVRAEQSTNPTFPSPELDLSRQSTSLPALQGHEAAANARAGGQVSLPWPVGMAPGGKAGTTQVREVGTGRQTPSLGLREGDLSSP